MRVLILALLLAGSGSAAPRPDPSVSSSPRQPLAIDLVQCRRLDVVPADGPAPPRAQRLGELPPGDTILAVYRTDADGCVRPVIVRYGDGRPAPPEAREGQR